MYIRKEVLPFIVVLVVACGLLVALAITLNISSQWIFILNVITFTACCYFLYFFRDPTRNPPDDDSAIVAGADGVIAAITELHEKEFLETDCIRISIFLSLFDVHVNRAPISGQSSFLGYFPGKHFFTFQEKSSDVNQHNKILIEEEYTRCLITQIVGPVCRRVVYWLDHKKPVDIKAGERIGMMKFGSRLDMYFPKKDIIIVAKLGDKVKAGETIIGQVIAKGDQEERK